MYIVVYHNCLANFILLDLLFSSKIDTHAK